MKSRTEYVVRIELHGRLLDEVNCDSLRDAALTARDLRPHHPAMSVEVYRPDNIDLGMPRGLTRDQVEDVEEWESSTVGLSRSPARAAGEALASLTASDNEVAE